MSRNSKKRNSDGSDQGIPNSRQSIKQAERRHLQEINLHLYDGQRNPEEN